MLDAPLFESIAVKKTYLIFDTSWVAHASVLSKAYSWMSCKRRGDGTDSPSGHIFGSIMKIMSSLKAYGTSMKETDLIFVFDEKPLKALELFPEYKAGRQHTFNPIPDVRSMISHLNCMEASCAHTEADHVVASLATKLSKERKVYVVSADKDLWQLLDTPNVFLVPRADERVSIPEFNKKFGLLYPRSIALHKAIFGDPSDNIPKLEGRLERKIISKYIDESDGTPTDFYERLSRCPEDMKPATFELLQSNKKHVKKMFAITELQTDVLYTLTQNKGSEKDLVELLHEFFIFSLDKKVNILF